MADPVAVICIGGAAIDRKYYAETEVLPATSNPVRGQTAFGGVARNVAENLARLGTDCLLVSAVGEDQDGKALLAHLRSADVGCDSMIVLPENTASYIAALNPDGSLAVALADMTILDHLDAVRIDGLNLPLAAAGWLFADCNLPAQSLRHVIGLARRADCRLAVDAVSVAKSLRLPDDLTGIALLFANQDEALAMTGMTGGQHTSPETAAAALQQRGAQHVVVTCGAKGCVLCSSSGSERIPAKSRAVVDATGAGDALIAGVLAALVDGADLSAAIRSGTVIAADVVASTMSVVSR